MKNNKLVSISCITYNHMNYIKQCLDSLLMQQTKFAYEILIHDDASNDGTAEIIREYVAKFPDIIKPIYQKENQYSKGVRGIFVNLIFPNARGKYIALCEGDDYWTDPLKLQKQVDLLEANPEYGLVYSKVRYYYQSKNKFARVSWGGKAANFDQLIISNQIPTLTTVFRFDLFREYVKDIQPTLRDWKMGDYPMWLYFALKSEIHFMNEVTGVYRVLGESVSHSDDLEKNEKFVKSYYNIKHFYLSYTNKKYDKQKLNDSLYVNLAINALRMNHKYVAKSYFQKVSNLTWKDKIKWIIFNSRILSLIYGFKNEF